MRAALISPAADRVEGEGRQGFPQTWVQEAGLALDMGPQWEPCFGLSLYAGPDVRLALS